MGKVWSLFVSILFISASISFADSPEVDRDFIISQIKSGEIDKARESIDRFIADNLQNPDLPKTLYEIAERYRWSDRFNESRDLHRRIVQNWPASQTADDSRFALVRLDVLSCISSGDYAGAQETLDRLVAAFPNHWDLPETLYWVARNFGWAEQHDREKNIYQWLCQMHPSSPFAEKARLGIARANIQSLILSQRFDDAQEALDRLMVDFAAHPDLPDALYWIAQKYSYVGQYGKEKELYQWIIHRYPNSFITGRARIDYLGAIARGYIVTGDYYSASQTIDEIVAHFNNQLYTAEVLYRLARGYEWQDKYDCAKKLFDLIWEKYPASSIKNKARIGAARAHICSLIAADRQKDAELQVEKMIEDFSESQDLLDSLRFIAQRYEYRDKYKQAKQIYQKLKDYKQASLDRQRSMIRELIVAGDINEANLVIDKLIVDFEDNPELPQALYEIAQRFGASGKYEQERKLYQLIIDKYSDGLYARKAVEGLKESISAKEIITAINSGNFELFRNAFNKLFYDLDGNPNLIKIFGEMNGAAYQYYYDKEETLLDGSQPSNRFYEIVTEEMEKYLKNKDSNLVTTKRDYYAMLYYMLGDVCESLGRNFHAVECYVTALEIEPDFKMAAQCAHNIGMCYQRMIQKKEISKEEGDEITYEYYKMAIGRNLCPTAEKMLQNWIKRYEQERNQRMKLRSQQKSLRLTSTAYAMGLTGPCVSSGNTCGGFGGGMGDCKEDPETGLCSGICASYCPSGGYNYYCKSSNMTPCYPLSTSCGAYQIRECKTAAYPEGVRCRCKEWGSGDECDVASGC